MKFLRSARSSPGMADSSSPSKPSESAERSGTPNTIPTAERSSPSTGTSPATRASKTSTKTHHTPTSSAAVSPVPMCPKPEPAKGSGSVTAPVSGTSSSVCFGYFDPDTRSLKTSQGSLLPDEDLEKSLEDWPRSGSMRNGRLFERVTLERRTTGAVSSSSPYTAPYPTPSATSYGTSGNGTGNNTESRGRPSLDTIAKQGSWPTPTAKLGDNRGMPSRETAERRYQQGRRNLDDAIVKWPTPCTTDSKDSARGTMTMDVMHPGTSLTDAMRGPPDPTTKPDGDDTLVLVPEFVEALMGLPEGWTLVDDDNVSTILEMALALRKQQRLSSDSFDDFEDN